MCRIHLLLAMLLAMFLLAGCSQQDGLFGSEALGPATWANLEKTGSAEAFAAAQRASQGSPQSAVGLAAECKDTAGQSPRQSLLHGRRQNRLRPAYSCWFENACNQSGVQREG